MSVDVHTDALLSPIVLTSWLNNGNNKTLLSMEFRDQDQ